MVMTLSLSRSPARSAKRVEENAAAADLNLSDADLARIDEILPSGGFGARYNEAMLPAWH